MNEKHFYIVLLLILFMYIFVNMRIDGVQDKLKQLNERVYQGKGTP